jgi:hypothetical protein
MEPASATSGLEILIWIGTAAALVGVAGLIWCIVLATRARNSDASDDDKRAQLQKVVTLNLAALGVSALGLMLVVAGIMLG